jgi:hypothetical protein
MVLKAEPGICVDADQLDCAGLVFMELFKPAPRPAFRINAHGRKGTGNDLTISMCVCAFPVEYVEKWCIVTHYA